MPRPSISRRALSWLAVLFAWSWGICGIFAAAGLPNSGASEVALGVLFFSSPLVATLIWKRFVVQEPLRTIDLEARFGPWIFVAWIAPILLVWGSALVAHLAGWAIFDLSGAGIVERTAAIRGAEEAAKVQAGLEAATLPYPVIVSLVALGWGLLPYMPLKLIEELGWRGVWADEARGMGFWPMAIVGGLLWGVWHVPMVLAGQYFEGDPVTASVALVAASTPIGALLHWIRVRTGTVWGAALAHGVLMAMAGFDELALRGGDPRLTSFYGASGAIVGAVVVVVLIISSRSGPTPPVESA